LKTVELASSAVWASNAERSQCRRKAFAYQARYGQPALFVTITPNTDSSFAMYHYTGISSVESLFDILDSAVPIKAELRHASLGNDSASTRLFMRHVDAFIKCALGVDPATRRKLPHRGLFGDVEAYFGMVETQGRGTLHIHFLIWLKHCPPNSAAVETILKSAHAESFRNGVQAYVSSIVSNALPISLDQFRCSQCGAPFSEVTELPIPSSARIRPTRNAAWRRKTTSANIVEPPLLQCRACNLSFMSQHVLRSVLLLNRPSYWPPWKSPLTPDEITEQAIAEVGCRNGMNQAVNIVDEREKCN